MDLKIKKTIKSMLIGALIYELVLTLLVLLFSILFYKCNKINDILFFILKNILAIIIGYACSAVAIYSMAKILSDALDTETESIIRKRVVISSIIRNLVYCAITCILINKKFLGVIGGLVFLISLFGIKIGAYLTPTIQNKFVR